MNKIFGIFGLLIFVCLFTTVLNGSFVSEYNLYNITRWSALFGILSIGVAFVIITGGIDLSIGSVVGLVACLLPMLVIDYGFSPAAAVLIARGCWAMAAHWRCPVGRVLSAWTAAPETTSSTAPGILTPR